MRKYFVIFFPKELENDRKNYFLKNPSSHFLIDSDFLYPHGSKSDSFFFWHLISFNMWQIWNSIAFAPIFLLEVRHTHDTIFLIHIYINWHMERTLKHISLFQNHSYRSLCCFTVSVFSFRRYVKMGWCLCDVVVGKQVCLYQ